ncbi:MAG: AraC family transcriptional regulator [Hymenobacter sp.]|nr:MAG: AraC family transcriptional regulator [Hymenobacter sp.]
MPSPLLPVYQIADFLGVDLGPVPFSVQLLEHMGPSWLRTPHRHGFYEILWITQGYSQQVIDYEEYQVAPGSLFIISPGQVHLIEPSAQLAGFCVRFTEEFFLLDQPSAPILAELSYLDNPAVTPTLPLPPGPATKLRTLLELLLSEFAQPAPAEPVLRALLLVLLTEIQRLYAGRQPAAAGAHAQGQFKAFRRLVEAHFAEHLAVADYASRLHLTPRHLNRLVQAVAACTASDVIRRRTVLEARRLLTFSALTVGQIAEQVGFADSSYFTRYFGREVGQAPLEYRQQMSEKYRI